MTDPDRTKFAAWSASWTPVLVLILVVTLARIIYLAWLCPYTLVEDEASYWEWSRHLEWSYYTKGPGIAWTIALCTKLLGNTDLAVRLPAVLSSAVAALCAAGLGREASGDKRVGFFAAACFLLVPAFLLTAMISTIDGPYVACWAAAAWAGWRIFGAQGQDRSPRWGAWAVLGAAMGLGTLYKYTMVLAIPGLVLFALRDRRARRARGASIGSPAAAALGTLLCLILLSPIAIWNVQHHWPTMRHLLGHLGVAGGDKPVIQGAGGWKYKPLWTLSYLGAQLATGPLLVLAWLEGRWAWRERREQTERWRGAAYLVWFAAPLLVFYLVVSFVANTQWNWTVAAYVTVAVLGGWGVVGGMDRWRGPDKTPLAVHAWRATMIVGLAVGLAVLRLDLFTHLPLIGEKIPVWRFTGGHRMARNVEQLADEIREKTGQEPFIMAQHYGRAAQLAFYMRGNPTVYCTSSLMLDGRLTPYDFWPETDLRRAKGLIGRPAIMVGNELEDWQPLFDKVELIGTLDGDGKKNRPAFKGYDFHGFPPGGLRSPGAPEFHAP